MTGPENYREAENCLDIARRVSDRGRGEDATFWQREALVRSNLAIAAATALHREGVDGTMPSRDRAQWFAAAAAPALSEPGEKATA